MSRLLQETREKMLPEPLVPLQDWPPIDPRLLDCLQVAFAERIPEIKPGVSMEALALSVAVQSGHKNVISLISSIRTQQLSERKS